MENLRTGPSRSDPAQGVLRQCRAPSETSPLTPPHGMVMRFLPVLLLPFVLAASPVKVWQGTLTLPTYEEGPPDPNPSFDIFLPRQFNYPYTLRENLTDRRVDRNWRALFL